MVFLALSFLPALVAIAALVVRWRRAGAPALLVAETPAVAVVSGEVDPLDVLDGVLAELEVATVRLHGADELDEGAVGELERLAARLEAAAGSLERVG